MARRSGRGGPPPPPPPLGKYVPPPSPIPTGRGTRSAADHNFSQYLHHSSYIPHLTDPPNPSQSHPSPYTPYTIPYPPLSLRDPDSIHRLLRSAADFGAFIITTHGIPTNYLRQTLDNCHSIFALTTTYRDHQKLRWCSDDRQMTHEAISLIGRQNFHIFRQILESVAEELEGIAQELVNVISESGLNNELEGQGRPIPLGEPSLSIYRYHVAVDHSINNNNSAAPAPAPAPAPGMKRRQELGPCALTLHLLLHPTEFCLEHGHQFMEFVAAPDTLIVTIGKEIEEWSLGEVKSAKGKPMFRPWVHAMKPSFSIEHKWSSASNFRKVVVGKPRNVFTLLHQLLLLLIASLVYNFIHALYF